MNNINEEAKTFITTPICHGSDLRQPLTKAVEIIESLLKQLESHATLLTEYKALVNTHNLAVLENTRLVEKVAGQQVVIDEANALLNLKKHKIVNGKDNFYLIHKEQMWFNLEEALSNLSSGGK